MIERQRIRDLATPRPRAYAGFGVVHNGRLLVDTIQTSPGRAKEAAISNLHSTGIRWSHLAEDGHRLVTVSITVLGDLN